MRHQIAALEFWNQGKHRESATNYWLAFRGIPNPTHEARYHIFHGYTTTLRGDYFEATDDDVKNMEQIFRDKHEPRLFRLEAGYTLGVISYSRSERLKCQDFYHRAITIGGAEKDDHFVYGGRGNTQNHERIDGSCSEGLSRQSKWTK